MDLELARPTYPDGFEHFSGAEERRLDDKSRVLLPAGPWRAKFEGGGKLTIWKGCLSLWTLRSYGDVSAYLHAQVRAKQLPEWAFEDFREDARDAVPDVQGRLPLPEDLRGEVGIGAAGAKVLLSGQGDRIDIWDLDTKRDARARRSRGAYMDALSGATY